MGRCCCCNCLFNCVCACIFQIFCALLLIFGLIALCLWLIFRPTTVHVFMEDATLAKFDFSPDTSMLDYDISLNVSIRNSNTRMEVIYDSIDTKARYDNRNFAATSLPTFHQGTKNTSFLNPVLKGSSEIHCDKSKYNDEKKSGAYDIFTLVYMRVRFKSGWITTNKFKLLAVCELKVPVKSNDASSTHNFERKGCLIVPWKKFD